MNRYWQRTQSASKCWAAGTLVKVNKVFPSGCAAHRYSSGRLRRCNLWLFLLGIKHLRHGHFSNKMSQSRRPAWMTFPSLAFISPWPEKKSLLSWPVLMSSVRGCSHTLVRSTTSWVQFWKIKKKIEKKLPGKGQQELSEIEKPWVRRKDRKNWMGFVWEKKD